MGSVSDFSQRGKDKENDISLIKKKFKTEQAKQTHNREDGAIRGGKTDHE